MADALDILAIAAHRDDVEQTCGGTLLKAAQQGKRTGILDLTQGELGITDDLTIDGDTDHNGSPDISISANHASRVFNIHTGAPVTAALNGLVIEDGRTSSAGAGIHADGPDMLRLTNSVVRNNAANGNGGGIYLFGGASVVASHHRHSVQRAEHPVSVSRCPGRIR